jgi:hypothetical protein
MSFTLTQPVLLVNPNANIDKEYGPYISIAEAIDALTSDEGVPTRQKGKTVGIIMPDGGIREYWFKNGIEPGDLVPKVDIPEVIIQNRMLTFGTYSRNQVGLDVQFAFTSGYSAIINSNTVNAPAANITIAPAATNKQRWDVIVIRSTGFVLLSGDEVTVNPVKPQVNNNIEIMILEVLVNENTIGQEVVIDTVDFVKKQYYLPINISSEDVLDLNLSYYYKIQPTSSGTIQGFKDSQSTLLTQDNWLGKPIIIENISSEDTLTLVDSSLDTEVELLFKFDNSQNLIIPPLGRVMLVISTIETIQFLSRSWQDTSGVYNGPSVSTANVGNFPPGTNIGGMTVDQLLGNLYAPFQAPTISSFSMSSQSTTVESGTTISGSRNFSIGFTNPGNLVPNSLSILDVTASNNIITSGRPISSPVSGVNVGSIQIIGNLTQQSWRARATSVQGPTVQSSLFTVTSRLRQFFGAVSSFPTDSGEVRLLPQSNFTDSNTLTFTGSTNRLVFAIPITKQIDIASTSNNETITGNFTENTMEVADLGGNLFNYRIYTYQSVLPLGSNVTITITLKPA